MIYNLDLMLSDILEDFNVPQELSDLVEVTTRFSIKLSEEGVVSYKARILNDALANRPWRHSNPDCSLDIRNDYLQVRNQVQHLDLQVSFSKMSYRLIPGVDKYPDSYSSPILREVANLKCRWAAEASLRTFDSGSGSE